MSGIVGILRTRATVDRALLRSLTRSLADCGPDGQDTWAADAIGFGHAALRTTQESAVERQPATIDGRFWITADVRLDARKELETRLASAGRQFGLGAPDSELILHAYAAWGAGCVKQLRGDFAFALWDAREKTLFCARDHFGIKPFYYARLKDSFVFSNVLACLRLVPGTSDELNDSAIADFLLFGTNYDLESTAFRDIRRVPPAHSLTISSGGSRLERYWTPPIDGRIRYHHADEYVEHFQVLLRGAVADRLRTNRAGILLSGGLDSSSVAATARELSCEGGTDLRAYTVTYEALLRDQDPQHARHVAAELKIPIRCVPMDDLQLFDRWADPDLTWPEPVADPFFAGLFDQMGAIVGEDCRVVLSGEGIDNLMHFQMWPYARCLMRKREWRRLARDGSAYLQRRPSIWSAVRRRAARVFKSDPAASVFPRWISRDFAKRLKLSERWRECSSMQAPVAHPMAPEAHASLLLPQWSQRFELESPGVTRCPVEVRYPFLDLRIVNYVLALPPFPWSFEKTLLREAMLGHLPETIRLRKKAPLAGDPLIEMLGRPDANWVDETVWSRETDRYADRSALPKLSGANACARASIDIRAHCLNFWLQSSRGVRYNLYAEVRNG